jgi:dipeptidyl aminopeptidase/acylaminoacyl peptidase
VQKSRLLVPLIVGTLLASARGDFTLEQLLAAPYCSQLVTSQGGRIAWVMAIAGRRNVWVADAPEFAARQLTHFDEDDGQAIASLRLGRDGRIAVFARGSEVNEAGVVANPASRVAAVHQTVFAVSTDGGAPWPLGELGADEEGGEDIQLSPDGRFAVWAAKHQLWIASLSDVVKDTAKQLTFARGSQGSPRWSPDGKRIVFVSNRGDHALATIYEFGQDSLRYLAPSSDRDLMPCWSRDGTQVAFLRIPGARAKLPLIPERPTPWSLWVADLASGKAHAIWQSADDENGDFPGWAADSCFLFGAGNRIVFGSEQDGRNHLYSIAASGGPAILLTPGDFDVEQAALSADGQSVIYTSNQVQSDPDDVDRRHLWRVAAAGGAPPAPLTSGTSLEWSPGETGDGRFVVCLGAGARTPAMPYYLANGGRQMIARSAIASDFPEQQLVEPRDVTFPSSDGLTIHGQLFVPRGRTVPGPALIFTHGGPIRQMLLGYHYMDYYHNTYAANQFFAQRGYVVLSVNYRLGIMYGRAFREPKRACWRGASEYLDVLAGARFLASLPIVDPNKVGLWGGSYGGFLTALGLARNSDVFKAGVDFHGVHDWSAFLPRWQDGAMEAPDKQEALKLAFESSPNAAIASWRSPVLLIQGDDDRNVPASQTVNLVQLLREQGVRYEEIFLPDEIHDFLLHRTWLTVYAAMADFFGRELPP